ncbi:hypothetical protein ACHQM5_027306 [Ranunculus cassubicifolius]
MEQQQHFVLVHGAAHGAWCWYKVETLLKSAGHKVTSLDMAASGINPKQANEVISDSVYYEPLTKFMESVSEEEKVVLVAHSLTGLGITAAMERFPDKIFVAVFVAAAMPGLTLTGEDIRNENDKKPLPMDNEFGDDGTLTYGPEYLKTYMYQLCTPEDFTLATKLVRPVHFFIQDETQLTKENYGSVRRAYVITGEDEVWGQAVQQYNIDNNPPVFKQEIQSSGHMVMLSKPHELYTSFLAIVEHFL